MKHDAHPKPAKENRKNPSDGAGSESQLQCFHNVEAEPTRSARNLSRPVNLSTRVFVDIGERVAMAAFIVTDDISKKVLLRGVGPIRDDLGARPLVEPPSGLGPLPLHPRRTPPA
jgi:hypothetical protein